jgi:hypothetical protein
MYLAARDSGVVTSIRDVVGRWGGDFFIEDQVSWKRCILEWKESGGVVVHLTMYGEPLASREAELRERDRLLVVVGAEKVPGRSAGSPTTTLLYRTTAFGDLEPGCLPGSPLLGGGARAVLSGCPHTNRSEPGREGDRRVMKKKVLVAGFATRHVVQSAFGAGYEVYAVDHFCDQDLPFYARESMPLPLAGSRCGGEMCQRHEPGFWPSPPGPRPFHPGSCAGPPEGRRLLNKLETQGSS